MCGFIGFFNRNDNITPAQAGYAAAMSIVILVMVAILAVIQMKVGDER